MTRLFSRLPSKKQAFRIFLAILVPINFWSVIFFFRELPAYILRLTTWDILGIFSYTQFIALLDSLLLLLILLIPGLLFSPSLREARFVPIASTVGYLAVVWVIPFHYLDRLTEWSPLFLQPWVAWAWVSLFILVSGFTAWRIHASSRLRNGILSFIERVTPLSWIYLSSNMVSVLIILARNFGLR